LANQFTSNTVGIFSFYKKIFDNSKQTLLGDTL